MFDSSAEDNDTTDAGTSTGDGFETAVADVEKLLIAVASGLQRGVWVTVVVTVRLLLGRPARRRRTRWDATWLLPAPVPPAALSAPVRSQRRAAVHELRRRGVPTTGWGRMAGWKRQTLTLSALAVATVLWAPVVAEAALAAAAAALVSAVVTLRLVAVARRQVATEQATADEAPVVSDRQGLPAGSRTGQQTPPRLYVPADRVFRDERRER